MKSAASLLATLAYLGHSANAAPHAAAPSCATTLSSSIAAPSLAPGYSGRLVSTGLSAPRGIIFDSAGHLLVVQQGVGVEALTLDSQAGACVTEASRKTVISDTSVSVY